MLMNNNEYLDLVQTIKQEIQQAQYKATLSVNKELIMLYYNIGKIINEHKSRGNKFIENLAADIKLSFPNAKGYSVRNLKYMSKFASTYPDEQFVQTVSAQIPWSHNVAILDKVKGEKQREWYIRKTAENGWSHNVLIHQIESGLYERQAIADKISNFESRLASPQSELAVQTMKDPYIFDFIPFKEDMVERDIEQALVQDVTKLLLELGTGFAFLGNQYHLNVGGDDFYIDLLFYNLNLRCYVVIELKTGEFKPEYAGQLMLQAYLISNMPKVTPRLFLVLKPLSIHKGNGVDDEVTVEMFCIQVSGNNHLKSLAPHLSHKLHSNLLRLFRSDLVFLETQIPVICLNPTRLIELFLDGNELITSHIHIAVDTIAEKLVLRFFLVLRIGKHIFERLIIFGRIFGINCLFRISRIIEYLTEPDAYLPKFCYCHFRPLFSGRRNSRSIAACNLCHLSASFLSI